MRVTLMPDSMERLPIVRELMKVDTRTQAIDIQKIDNRRFMYDPQSGTLILGRQYGKTKGLPGSHAEDLAAAGVTQGYDGYIRGWVGTGKDYPHGVIHFAPHIDSRAVALFDKAFDTLEMFGVNGAHGQTIVRGFCDRWEQPLSSILHPERKAEQKPSVLLRLKVAQSCENQAPHEAEPNQER